MIDRNHPAVEAVELAAQRWIADTTGKARSGTPYMLSVALPHLTANDLRDTPAGQALIREGIAAARNLEWMQPRMTPGGRIFNPAIPGDDLRAFREEALAREAMQNMRESEQGRELMAEAWEEGAMDHAAATSRMTPETRRIINELMKAANPYLERNA